MELFGSSEHASLSRPIAINPNEAIVIGRDPASAPAEIKSLMADARKIAIDGFPSEKISRAVLRLGMNPDGSSATIRTLTEHNQVTVYYREEGNWRMLRLVKNPKNAGDVQEAVISLGNGNPSDFIINIENDDGRYRVVDRGYLGGKRSIAVHKGAAVFEWLPSGALVSKGRLRM